MKRWNAFLHALAQPVWLNILLPLIMIYLVIGTVAQKYIGLYGATHLFFADLLVWVGPLPLPGMPVLIGGLFVCLIAKLILKSPWTKERAGSVITHIGAAFLIIGGLLTMGLSKEGYVDLAIGQEKAFVADYHQRQFAILDAQGDPFAVFDHDSLREGQILTVAGLPLKIKIEGACRHCAIERRRDDAGNYEGMAAHMALRNEKPRKEDEENLAGVTFSIQNLEEPPVMIALENIPQFPSYFIEGIAYSFAVRRAHRNLPFSVQLLDFKKDSHPGTSMARDYESRVLVKDGSTSWESTIRMNEPLRYKGYALYQSSFLTMQDGSLVSVLAVVENTGRSFPYIAGILMCFGMILHLWLRPRRREKK